jgi:hypothetical protein
LLEIEPLITQPMTSHYTDLAIWTLNNFFFILPIQALAACMKLSVSLQLLDLGQLVGLLGWVISSSQGLYQYTYTEKRTQALNIQALSGIRTHGPGVHMNYRDRP